MSQQRRTMYTVIAHMDDGATYSRGCVMESWGSDFELVVTDDATEAAARIAHYEWENEKNKKRDDIGHFEITLLVNGRDDHYAMDHDIVEGNHVKRMVEENLKQLRAVAELKRLELAKQAEQAAKDKALAVEQKERELLEVLRKKYA